MYARKFIADGFKSDFLRSRENLRDQTGALNQRGIEYALDELARQGKKQCAFIKVALENLGQYNDEYGHDLTDELLYKIREFLSAQGSPKTKFNIYRVGADWVILFEKTPSRQAIADIQKKIHNMLQLEDFKLKLTSTAVITELKPNTLHSIYLIIDHLKPAKGEVFQKNIFNAYCCSKESVKTLKQGSIFKLTNLLISPRAIRIEKEYLQKYKYMERLINNGASYREIEAKIMSDINEVLPEECLEIKNIHLLDYNSNFRVIGNRTVFIDQKTIIMPLLNAYNKPTGALRIELSKPFPIENYGEKSRNSLHGKDLYRFDRRARRINVQEHKKFIENVEAFFNTVAFINTYNLLVDLRRYSPVISLLDQTGRSSFFSRAIEPYLQDILEKKKKHNDLPEYEVIENIFEKDGFLVIKRGGEEFFICFAPDKNAEPVGLSFDYNKFSRHSTSWGEYAGDYYMERTSGLLRHHLVEKIAQYKARNMNFNKEILTMAFLEALEEVNARPIEFVIRDLNTKIINKEGKQIFYAVNENEQTVFFAAANSLELALLIKRSGERLKSPLLFSEEAMLTRKKLLELNGLEPKEFERYDLNKLKAINPKGVYHFENYKVKGQADQQLLWGLSLAGGIMTVMQNLRSTIKYTDNLAEQEKVQINEMKIHNGHQVSAIRQG